MPPKIKFVILFCLVVTASQANQRYSNSCQQGGKTVVTTGVSGAPKVQGSYPQCQVAVYLTGTVTLASIFSDNSGTVKANPFTANTDGSYFFYAANGRYDVTMSSGGLPAPVTVGDVLLADGASSTSVSSITAGFGISVNQPTGAVTVTNTWGAKASDYNFSAQSPGGSIAVGSNTIALLPCPLGVNGADTGHYYYLSGGTGTAEAALGTGGTCVSGAASGTVIVTAANTHTGAWTIRSGSGGLAEALIANPGATVRVASSLTAYAATTFTSSASVECDAGATLTWGGAAAGNMLVVAANQVRIEGCSLNGGATATIITDSGSRSYLTIAGNTLYNAVNAIDLSSTTHAEITGNRIHTLINTGVCIGCTTGALPSAITYISVTDNDIDSVGCTTLFCGAISHWGSHATITGNRMRIGGNQDGGIVWINNPGAGLTDVTITGNTCTVSAVTSFECYGVGSAANFTIANNTMDATVVNNVSGHGIEVNESLKGTVTGNALFGDCTTTGIGIYVESSTEITVAGNELKGWACGSPAISLQHTNATCGGRTSCALSNNLIAHNVIVTTSAVSTVPEIKLDTLVAGNVLNNVIQGNTIVGNTAAGHICIQIVNSGAATSSGHRITGNNLKSCDTGIEVVGTSIVIENNPMSGVTTKYSDPLASTPRIIDTNGVTFASFGSYANGSRLSCTDCVPTCAAGSGSGGNCARINGAWVGDVNLLAYNAAGTQQANAWSVYGTCTLGTNCAVTFTKVWSSSSSYRCTATDQTAAAAAKVVNTSSSVATFTGTGTDVLAYVCIGN